jgi:hypothetical protein
MIIHLRVPDSVILQRISGESPSCCVWGEFSLKKKGVLESGSCIRDETRERERETGRPLASRADKRETLGGVDTMGIFRSGLSIGHDTNRDLSFSSYVHLISPSYDRCPRTVLGF